MTHRIIMRCLAPAVSVALLAGCGLGTAVPTAAPEADDPIATQVAIAQAVAATLTAAVPTAMPAAAMTPDATTPATPVIVVDTPVPAHATMEPTATNTAEPSVEPTQKPTDVPDEPLPVAYGPSGNSSNVEGGVVLPDNAQITNYEANNDLKVVLNSPLWFRVLAYVPNQGGANKDGAGIKEVRIEIVGPLADGENGTVHQKTEMNAPYCVFSDNGDICNMWDFASNTNAWPDGAPVQYGENYHVQINVEGKNGDADASWNFNFTIEEP